MTQRSVCDGWLGYLEHLIEKEIEQQMFDDLKQQSENQTKTQESEPNGKEEKE